MPTPPLSDEALRDTLEALAAQGGNTALAAAALRISRNSLYHRLARAASRGLDGSVPRPVPVGQSIKGVSTLYGRNGQIAAQWVKTRSDRMPLTDIIAAIQDAVRELPALAQIAPPVAPGPAEVLNVFLLPDLHLGMQSWAAETGSAYDLTIAEALARGAFTDLVNRAPPAAHAVILGLGDITHADNDSAVTRRSGNHLDVDSRHQKVLMAAIRLLMWKIIYALGRFDRVTVRILKGNHDEETAAAISVALAVFYEAEPRVTIDADPGLWWFMRHGKVLLGGTHGHNCKAEDMPGVMASRCAADWGVTVWRYIHHGHWHHKRAVERLGVVAECFQSPAAPDAWHAGAGYTAGRSLTAISYHAERGESGRVQVNIPPRAITLEVAT